MSYPEAIEAIKKKATEMGISQVELAAASDTSPAYISRIFKLEREASDQVLQRLAVAVKLPPLEILRLANRIHAETKETPIIKEIAYLTSDLPDSEQQDILEFVKLRHRLAEERGTYETKRPKKSTSTNN
jgi:transcriptional regulator with XRE-family HTH domain